MRTACVGRLAMAAAAAGVLAVGLGATGWLARSGGLPDVGRTARGMGSAERGGVAETRPGAARGRPTSHPAARPARRPTTTPGARPVDVYVTPPSLGTSGAPLNLSFSRAVEREGLTRSLVITPALGALATMAWAKDGHDLALAPAAGWPDRVTYRVSFAAPVCAADGRWCGVPRPRTFTSPSPIVRHLPQTGSADEWARIEVAFDRPMDHDRTAAALAIAPAMAGEATWEGDTLVFTPAVGAMPEQTAMTVSVGTACRDARGAPVLLRPYSWTFATGTFPDAIDFGWGPKVQALSPDGARRIDLARYSEGPIAVDLSLTAIDPADLLDRLDALAAADAWGTDDDGPLPVPDGRVVWTERRVLGAVGRSASESRGYPGPATGPSAPPTAAAPVAAAQVVVTEGDGAQAAEDGHLAVNLPLDLAPGAYLLQIAHRHVADRLVVVLTRHAVTVKTGDDQVVVWVTDTFGEVAPGVTVTLYDADRGVLAEGTTDDTGVWRVDGPAGAARWVVARAGDDVSVAGVGGHWRSGGNGGWWGWEDESPRVPDRHVVHTHTDRPIYRPGQTVFFKAVVRQDADAVLSLPASGTAVEVQVRDARDNRVRTIALATNEFGTVSGAFELAEGAMLGTYNLAISIAGDPESHRQPFKVEDYRRPDYEVVVRADRASYTVGDTMSVTVEARYLHGGPVAGAAVGLRRHALYVDYGAAWAAEDGSGAGDADLAWGMAYDDTPATGRTDAAGRLSLQIETPAAPSWAVWGPDLKSAPLGLEATVDDGSHQTVAGQAVATVYDRAQWLALDAGPGWQAPGVPFDVAVTARGVDGSPMADAWLAVKVLRDTAARAPSGIGPEKGVVLYREVRTDAVGRASVPVTLDRAGDYHIEVTGRDTAQREIAAERWVQAYAGGEPWWADGSADVLRVRADRDTYVPGDIAHLVVASRMAGAALVAVERGTTRRERLVTLSPPLTAIDEVVRADDAPNVFVTVSAWEPTDWAAPSGTDGWGRMSRADATLHTATVELQVPAADRRLGVDVSTDAPVYRPRQSARIAVTVTDGRGSPRAGAEVSVAVVDDAVYALSGELSGPLFDAFYHRRAHGVRTYDSLAPRRYLSELGGGGGGGGEGDYAARPRGEFPDTLTWSPALVTDADGRLTVDVTLPDTLTRWRITARAVTADTAVGEGRATFETAQPVVVRPLLPRNLVAGDRFELAATVHHAGPETVVLDAVVETDGLEVVDESPRRIALRPGEWQRVTWSAAAPSAGTATVTFAVRTVGADGRPGTVADAVRSSLPVQALVMRDVDALSGEVNGLYSTFIDRPVDVGDASSVRVDLARSAAAGVLDGLDYLTGYPYGCVEQTMSRALPNAVVGRAWRKVDGRGAGDGGGRDGVELADKGGDQGAAGDAAGGAGALDSAELSAKVNAGLQRLYGFQHDDGGWGWWSDDDTDDYQTAWVVFGLAVTADAGYEVSPEVIDRGAAYLTDHLADMDRRTRAFALYAMAVAGRPDRGASADLAKASGQLDAFSRAALALAFDAQGDAPAAERLVEALVAEAARDGSRAHWGVGEVDGVYHDKTMASSVRTTALVLSALIRVRPGHPLEAETVRWLVGMRRAEGWGTTNETAFAVLALTDHLVSSQSAEAGAGYSVVLDGAVVLSGTFGSGDAAAGVTIPVSELTAGVHRLDVARRGTGRLYYTIARTWIRERATVEAAGAVGVSRTYLYTVSPDHAASGAASAGEIVQVRLTVDLPEAARYVIVEDRLAGGLEALNEGLANTSHTSYDDESSDRSWQQRGYNQKEVRADRVSFFMTYLPKGRRTFTYYARATRTGRFTAPPAEVWAMYDAAMWGRSGSAVVAVAE
jgi:alpha-2-macroglobulin